MLSAKKLGNLLKQVVTPRQPFHQTIRCMSSSKLFIGGLSFGTDSEGLREAFTNYGDVVEAKVIVDQNTQRSRGFGFVTFASSEEATAAMSSLDGKELHGRIVRVSYAHDRPGGYRAGFARGSGYGGAGGIYGASGYGGADGGAFGGNYGRDNYRRGDDSGFSGNYGSNNFGGSDGGGFSGNYGGGYGQNPSRGYGPTEGYGSYNRGGNEGRLNYAGGSGYSGDAGAYRGGNFQQGVHGGNDNRSGSTETWNLDGASASFTDSILDSHSQSEARGTEQQASAGDNDDGDFLDDLKDDISEAAKGETLEDNFKYEPDDDDDDLFAEDGKYEGDVPDDYADKKR